MTTVAAPDGSRRVKQAKPSRRFRALKSLSFAHSAIYICLLAAAFGVRALEPAKPALGWAHGLMWIAISLLCLVALRARIISLWLAVCVIVIGGLGPFVGTIAFVIEGRRRWLGAQAKGGSD